ncbi:MAG: sulfotransferase [Terriglobales bacterium]|jgi:sulfotransferase family protein
MSSSESARGESTTGLAAGPLFVVSMWRSGSSLLYALLNKHPQVGLMFEADLALLRPLFLKPRRWQDWARRWEFWNQALARHQLRAQDIPNSITGFRDAFTAVHQQYAKRKGATIWGDKSPNYYDRLNEIAEIFPDARFIIVWRDPADTISSMVRAGRVGSDYFGRKGSALRGLLGCQVLKQQCGTLVFQGKPVLQLHYEDLVHQPATVMREVCGFLQIPYTDDLSSLQGADRSAIYDYGSKHHALVKGDRIVSAPRPDAIDPALRRKIAGYVARWRGLGQAGPKLPERILDQLEYRGFRGYDRLTALGFCFLPSSLLLKYRAWKYGRSGSGETFRRRGAGAGLEVNS